MYYVPMQKGTVTTRKRPMSFWRKKAITFAIFVVGAVLCEMITFGLMGFGVFPRYFLLDLAIILFLAGVVFVIPFHSVSVSLACVLFLCQCLLSAVHATVFHMTGTIFTLEALVDAKQAVEAFSMGHIPWERIVPYIALAVLFVSAGLLVLLKVKSEKFSFTKRNSFCLAGIFAVCCTFSPLAGLAYTVTLPDDNESLQVSVKENFEYLTYEENYLKSFGTLSLFYKNFVLRQSPGTMRTRDVDELNTEFLKSDYFGIDKDNNVIIVMTESFDKIFLSEKYTPNMYKVHNEGIGFTNYHTYNKTDISEAIGILGNYPQSGTLVAEWNSGDGNSWDSRKDVFSYDFPFSTPNVLRNNGYEQCNYFIAHNGWYYSRQYTHKSYGFDNVYFNESYPHNANFDDYEKYVYSWTMPERYFINSALEELMPKDKRFFSYMSFINPHLPYDYDPAENTGIFRTYYDKIDDADFADFRKEFGENVYRLYKNGLTKAMVADNGIEYLLQQLAERGLEENTTVLFYTDHPAYGDSLKFTLQRDPMRIDPVSYNLPASIWSKNICALPEDARRITKFVNTFDLIPTLYDLIGVEIDSKAYLGLNAFASEESIVISKFGNGIFNDRIYMNGAEVLYTAAGVTGEELDEFIKTYVQTYNKWSRLHKAFLVEKE